MSEKRPIPRVPRGFRDTFAPDLIARNRLIELIRTVYERYGFEPLETPAVEYVDVLGKFLPESETPDGGIFAFKYDDTEWAALRYDLTAPLSRVVAQRRNDLPAPYRRYQIGPVWRLEKPGHGRYREFYQFDIDTVGTPSMAADAEICAALADSLEALGIQKKEYSIRVNNRKVLNGVLETLGLLTGDAEEIAAKRLTVLRAVDKLDRLGLDGVRDLLGKGRIDTSGDFLPGAQLDDDQIKVVMAFITAGNPDRVSVCAELRRLVGQSPVGSQGVAELEEMDALLTAAGYSSDQVVFDPSVVRGLGYYTGPVFEAHLNLMVEGEEGGPKPVGAVAGGGRYDDLVQRFTGEMVPATGASIGVDRLLAALKETGRTIGADYRGPVVVTIMVRERLADYQRMVQELRRAGINAELYLGEGDFRTQLKYADKRRAPVAVIAGTDEFSRGEVSLKNLRLGEKLAKEIASRDEWRKSQPAQRKVPISDLVVEVRRILQEGEERARDQMT